MVTASAAAVNTFQGIVLGTVFAALALGFNLVYRVSKSINLAHPALVLMAAYIALVASKRYGLGLVAASGLAAAAAAAAGALLEPLIARPLRGRPPVALIAATLGAYYVFKALAKMVAGDLWTTASLPMPGFTARLGPLVVDASDLLALGLAGGLVAAVVALHRWTRLGVAMRAVAEDPYGAAAYGLPVRMLTMLSWGIAGASAGLAAVALAAKTGVEPSLEVFVIEALAASLLAGLDSIAGVAVGGLVLGLVYQFSNFLLGSVLPSFGEAAAFTLMLLVLLVKPYGLFGTERIERV
jgi:branched-chain amino acid transport system permease protein